jgi:hypothetical protein
LYWIVLSVQLPCFVALDLARIPTVKIEDVELYTMELKLEALEERMKKVEVLAVQPRQAHVANTALAANRQSAVVSSVQPISDSNLLATSEGCDTMDQITDDNPNPWSTVAARSPRLSAASGAFSRQPKPHTKRREKIICDGVSKEGGIKSAINIVKKNVFHVDNIDEESTPESIVAFLKTENIAVESCFTTKSWMRASEQNKVAAFRVCVRAEDRDRFLDKSLWSRGIMIRDWRFKKQDNAARPN